MLVRGKNKYTKKVGFANTSGWDGSVCVTEMAIWGRKRGYYKSDGQAEDFGDGGVDLFGVGRNSGLSRTAWESHFTKI